MATMDFKDTKYCMSGCMRCKYMRNFPGIFYLPDSTLLVKFSMTATTQDLKRALKVVENDVSILHVLHVGKDRYGRQLERKAEVNYRRALDLVKGVCDKSVDLDRLTERDVIAMIDAIKESKCYKILRSGKAVSIGQMDEIECKAVKFLYKFGVKISERYKSCLEINKASSPTQQYMEFGFDD